ncbi:MAG: hypothetical protein C0407_00070 [Desulfobacca sp.]|nr:hypothetical protein [Desulfobacca sp.]
MLLNGETIATSGGITVKKRFLIFIPLMLGLLLGIISCKGQNIPGSFNTPKLSFYNNKVLFVSCGWGSTENSCNIVLYDVFTKETRVIHHTESFCASPTFSGDGGKIAYHTIKDNNCNLFIMDADGKNVRQLTHDYNDPSKTIDTYTGKAYVVKWNSRPSFSPDGTKIIFARAGIKRQRTLGQGTMYSNWDIFEMDIESGKERQLTDYKFYMISNPYYLSDGKKFIFWGDAPLTNGKEKNKEYERQYQENNIFIMDGKNNALRPAIIYGDYTSEPTITRDDTIVFLAKTNETDGLPKNPYYYDLFLKKGNSITRLTRMKRYISDPSISFDGSRIFFQTTEEKNILYDWIINSDGTGLTRFNLPANKSLIISGIKPQ